MTKKKGINWISCKDELPEDDELVLAYGDCGANLCRVEVTPAKQVRFWGTSFNVTHWARVNIPRKLRNESK